MATGKPKRKRRTKRITANVKGWDVATTSHKVTLSCVTTFARLNLNFTPDEADRLAKDLGAAVRYIRQTWPQPRQVVDDSE